MNQLQKSCQKIAAKFESIDAWMNGNPISYNLAKENKLLVVCCEHLPKRQRWNLDSCKEDALNYGRKTAWQTESSMACSIAKENGWHKECTSHMSAKLWNYESCFADAQNYTSRSEWMGKSSTAYHLARREGWLDDFCAHMTGAKLGKPAKWTFEACMASAAKYNAPNDWQTNEPSAYQAALRKNAEFGWKDKCIAHMTTKRSRKTLH